MLFDVSDDPAVLRYPEYRVYDGNETAPNNLLFSASTPITPGIYQYMDVATENIQIDSADFFISFYEPTDSLLALAWDKDGPLADRSWVNSPDLGINWQLSSSFGPPFDSNYMIRAVIHQGNGEIVEVDANGNVFPHQNPVLAQYSARQKIIPMARFDDAHSNPIATQKAKAVFPPKPIQSSVTTDLIGYEIYRANEGGGFNLIASVDSSIHQFEDDPLKGGIYTYVVTAVLCQWRRAINRSHRSIFNCRRN